MRYNGFRHFLCFFIAVLFFGLVPKTVRGQTLMPAITGTFLHDDGISLAEVPQIMQEIERMGMDTVIVDYTRNQVGGCGSAYGWNTNEPSKLDSILAAAQTYHLQVYVGLGLTHCDNFVASENREKDATDMQHSVATILERNANNSQLAGWYIPNEPSLAFIDDPAILEQNYQYYKSLVTAIRLVSSKPIIVSPILAGAANKTPTSIAQKALNLKTISGVTIEAWQDSEGTYSTPLDWNRGTIPTYQLKDYFNAISAAIGKDSFWSDIELFSCPIPENTWDLGGCSLDWNLYRPASGTRIQNQIQHSSGAGKIVSWISHTMMGQTDSRRFPEADRLYATYMAQQNNHFHYEHPVSYQWVTPPASQYPDRGNALFDNKTADPRNASDPGWVGINGTAEIKVDLGVAKNIQWVGSHVLTYSPASIKFPTQLELKCSLDTVSWNDVGSWNLSVPIKNSDYLFSNPTALNSNCRYLDIKLINTSLTFLSEIEIVSTIKPGDANADNKVDGIDYLTWLNHYNQIVTDGYAVGDFNNDKKINGVDYVTWLNNYE